MSQSSPSETNQHSAAQDERLRQVSPIKKFLARPELGSIFGAVFIFVIFYASAGQSGMFNIDGVINWTTVAAYLGIISVGACLLMIAGEFDLSIGSMIAFVGLAISIPTLYWNWPPYLSIILGFGLALLIGYISGQIVIRTGLPSFIVTLAFLFILRGLTLALSVIFTNRTIISGMGEKIAEDPVTAFLFQGLVLNSLFTWFGENGWIETLEGGTPLVEGIPKVIVWWFILIAAGSFLLMKTRYGNWIFASGGDAGAAKNIGVPSDKVKISMFMFTAFCAALFATLQVAEIGSAAADRGLLKEFEAIIAAVIGGTLLTGGYGSVVGVAFGALIFGVVQIGIGYTDIDSNWFRVFLGLMLLLAVLFNNFVRNKISQ